MRLLEIFCGTKSMGKVFEKNEWEVISIDIEKKWKPTICIDVLEWDYKSFDKNYFDHIHFSPPCIYMSQMQQSWYGRYKGRGDNKYLFTEEIHKERLKESDKLLHKINEIIDYFDNITFTIENPYHTKFNNIINRNILKYDYSICDYCMYDYPIKKPTVFYNNFNLKLNRCDKSHTHTEWKKFCGGSNSLIEERYRLPEKLCEHIYNSIKK
mgnify:CR=1 FL=1|tara:strand:+ start:2445 stop:3077 length:633 start_codon:yes stop_codon:yes gene_type:complete